MAGQGRPRGSRNRLSEQFIADLQADWEQHGADVIERVRQDDPVAYLRTVAILVRPVPDSELPKNPYAHLSDDELKAEMLAGFSKVFPELRIVRRPALIEKPKDR
jgi:hypothetical protein